MSLGFLANVANIAAWSLIAVSIAGLLCVAYGVFIERRWYRSTTYRLDLLPSESSKPVSVLHLSDLHFVRTDRRKARFMASLPRPDVCVVTGDILGEPEAVDASVAALRPLRGRLASFFVLGSNDYFAPEPLDYTAYFRKRPRHRKATKSRAAELVQGLEGDGWLHLANRRGSFAEDGVRFEVVGLDDPHIERHDLRVAPRRAPGEVGLAVVHSPDPVPELAALGYDLILSGHTHGGQVRMPFVGALVTNSTIPPRLCMGLSRFGHALVHVSPGLGTSKYAPFRFLCRPEATVLELTSRQDTASSKTRS